MATKLKVNYEFVGDSTTPVTRTESIKHGDSMLNSVITSAVTALGSKADKSYVDSQDALKANKAEVDTALATKANAADVTSGLATKADSSTVSAIASRVSTNETNIATQTSRIDNIAALPSGSTSGDAELMDIRVGADGKTYTSAGAAVRGQISDVKSDLTNLSEPKFNLINPRKLTSDKYVNPSDGTLEGHSDYYTSDYIEVNENTQYSFSNTFTGAFYSENKTYITGGTYNYSGIISPQSAKYLRISFKKENLTNAMVSEGIYFGEYYPYEVRIKDSANSDSVKTLIDNVYSTISEGENKFNLKKVTNSAYINENGGISLSSDYCASDYINVENFTEINVFNSGLNGPIYYALYDSNKSYIANTWGSAPANKKNINKANNAKYIRISCNILDSNGVCVANSSNIETVDYCYVPKKYNNDVIASSGESGVNKFNKNRINTGKYIEPSTGNLDSNSEFFSTDYIDVEAFSEGCYILCSWSSGGMYAFYDTNKVYINGSTISMSYSLNIPSNAKYIRVSCKLADIDTLMIADSNIKINYEKNSVITDIVIAKESISDYSTPVTIKVKKDGTGDFTKVHEAFDYARRLVNVNDITIEIYPGEYDIFSDMGTEYINSHSSGMTSSDNTTVVGIGDRNDIILKGYCDDSFSESLKDQISTLMVAATNNFKLKNLTITAQNCRYAIHNDSAASAHDYNQEYEDLKIIYYGTNTDWFGACFGTGYHSGCDVTVKNCKLIAYRKSIPCGGHTNANYTKPFHVRFIDNEIITPDLNTSENDCSRVTFNCLNSGVLNFIEYTGNKQECPIEFINGSGSSKFDIEVYGHSNSSGFEVRNNSGIAGVECRFSDRN